MSSASHQATASSRKTNDTNSSALGRAPTQATTIRTIKMEDLLISASGPIRLAGIAALTLLSFITRFYRLDQPNHVCWDETHFGKMGSWYLNRSFFFDVHPPLGKMLIGFSGAVSGYNGSFRFEKPGDQYREASDYMGMRVMCATMGALLIPLVYGTVWKMTKSLPTAALAGCLVLLDTGTLTLTTYILLDPVLLFFIMLSAFCVQSFIVERYRPFTFNWWFWLVMSGVSLACAIGVKFVGLFIILLVGYTTVHDLYDLLCNLALPIKLVVLHVFTRTLSLIVVPILLYMAIFGVHFARLNQTGPGDGSFSAGFQIHLIGNRLHNATMPESIAYGSIVTVKQARIGGTYLHSHWHLYPKEVGPRQQQVTTYSHKDSNNNWIIKRFDKNPVKNEIAELLSNGDLIRLEHQITRRNLHSHKDRAPLTKIHQQVSCYGENGTGDSNDYFQIIVPGGQEGMPIKPIVHRFKLIHKGTGCSLQSHQKQLPKWGWEQLEVTCNPSPKGDLTDWFVEEVIDDRLPNVSIHHHAASFIGRFIESHQVMTHGNSGLKPKEDESTSRPWMWPIVYRGQFFSGKSPKIYMMGNPIIWWINIATIPVFILISVLNACRKQRKYPDSQPYQDFTDHFCVTGRWLLIGWAIHYIPFWSMSRVLYYHHYFPAHLFSCMLTAVVFHFLLVQIQRLSAHDSYVIYHVLYGIVLSLLVYSFFLFYPLSYGFTKPSNEPDSEVRSIKWLSSWDF